MARGGGLTQRAVEAAKPRAKRYRLQDRDGLLLEVRPTGSKAWLCRVTVARRRRDMGLGDYPTVTLAAARASAVEMKRQARAGLGPRQGARAGRGGPAGGGGGATGSR